ncbi:hypothetical protein LJC11_03215 [Bacteroidales bacterium OttesenSCG-928-I21]|nr:hypothetical protein [Bacteroidales bacterium OttesenSCG-928-I21]
MQNKLILSYIITSVFLISVVLVQFLELKRLRAYTHTSTEVVHVYDSTKREPVTPYEPKIEYVEKVVRVPAVVDTARIINDYFAKLTIVDTLVNDTTALIVVRDSLTENRLISRTWEYKNRLPLEIINTTVNQQDSKLKFGIGLAIGGNRQKFELAPGLMVSKNKNAFTLSYDLYCKSVRVGYYYCFN